MVDATNETAKLIYIVVGYSMRYKNMIAFFLLLHWYGKRIRNNSLWNTSTYPCILHIQYR